MCYTIRRLPLIGFLLSILCAFFAMAQVAVATDATTSAAHASGKHYLIFGASSGVGLELAKLLVARGDKVTAFVRPSSNRAELNNLQVNFVSGDALNRAQVDAAFRSARYDAVVTTLGCFKCPSPPDYEGNKNVFDAARAASHKRVLMVSTMGTGDTADAVPWIARRMLKDVIALKDKAEKNLMSGGLDYTILRPGALKDSPATGTGVMMEKVDSTGVIGRADVAALLVQCLDDETTIGKAYAVYDKNMSWPWSMF